MGKNFSGGKRKFQLTNFFTTLFDNAVAHNVQFDKLKEITLTLYKWLNLPPEIDPRFLELCLFERGHCVFFHDDVLDEYVVMNCDLAGKWNIYNIPYRRRAYATNGAKAKVNATNSVIIFNNMLHSDSIMETEYYADKIGFYDRIIDVNVNAQKTPIIIKCSENKRLSLKNAMMKYTGNEPIIFSDDALDLDGLTVLKTDAPFVADKIYDLKVKYWNEFLTFKGVSNINVQKKERLTNDEVYRQLGGSIACRGSGLTMRKRAAEEINKMFGLEIDVVFNEEYALQVKDPENEIIDPGDDVTIDDGKGAADNE